MSDIEDEITLEITQEHCDRAIDVNQGFRQWETSAALAIAVSLHEKFPQQEWHVSLDCLTINLGEEGPHYRMTGKCVTDLNLLDPNKLLEPFTATYLREPGYDEEYIIRLANGKTIRTDAYPNEVDYVRVCDADGKEIAYWSVDEWCESRDQASEVMGAILGACSDVEEVNRPAELAESATVPKVHASTHDDDYKFEIKKFHCTAWFEQASDEEIKALIDCDFGGDYGADAVAEFYDGIIPEITEMFRFKDKGFECHVNAEEAWAWIKVHRPHLTEGRM